MILRRIASHCVDETDGFFITLPEDDLNYQTKFFESCLAAGIHAEIMDPKEALRMEPSINPDIIGAVKVPDGSVDPFRLCAANMLDAKLHGAQVLLYSEVTDFIKDGDRIVGIKTFNHQTHKNGEYYANITVNAAGIWGHHIAELAGVSIGIGPRQGRPPHLRPPRERHRHQPLPQALQRRYSRSRRYRVHHRHHLHQDSFRQM
jgi:Glycerol-3-phosphate dehydrogenase